MAHSLKVSMADDPGRSPAENAPFPVATKTRVSGNRTPAAPKGASKKVRRTNEPPHWDFRKYGLLFQKDIDEALKLKHENPAGFKSSIRAQKIVAYNKEFVSWQISLARALAGNVPQPFRDLWAASDSKRNPKERLAALDRFARWFGKMPMNVAIAIFAWASGGPTEQVVKALDRTVVAFEIDPKTGALAEADGRGRRRSSATKQRIELAARRKNEGISERKMSAELFPNLSGEQAYVRTRDFFSKYRYAIELKAHHLRGRSHSSRKSPR